MLLELIPFGTPVQVACHRETFIKTGGWDSSLDTNCDDIDSWIAIAKYGDAIFINQCLAYRTVWTGAYNRKFSLSGRLATNILIKEKIYPLINQKYHSKLPSLSDIKKYLQLHWCLVAVKQKNFNSLFLMFSLEIFHPMAWRLFLSAIIARSFPNKTSFIQKQVLIDS